MIIMENALPENLFYKLKNSILCHNFTWNYESITGPYDDSFLGENYIYHFTHHFYDDQKGNIIDHKMNDLVNECIFSIIERVNKEINNLNLNIKEIYRTRTNLETIKPIKYEHTPHVDDTRRHIASILYLNDNDGDTIFYKQKYDSSKSRCWGEYMNYIKHNEGFEIEQTITPKENKVILFDGSTYHSSFTPTKYHTRCIVNFTFSTTNYY